MRHGSAASGRWNEGRCCLAAALALGIIGCATANDGSEPRDLARLSQELDAQSQKEARLQARVDKLEARLGELEAKSQPHSSAPDPIAALPVVRLRPSPASPPNAPPLDTSVDLEDPSDAAVAQLEAPHASLESFRPEGNTPADDLLVQARGPIDARRDWDDSITALRAFARRHPHDKAAAHALYLAATMAAGQGECAAGERAFRAAARDTPADAFAGKSLVALGECEAGLGRTAQARKTLGEVLRKYGGRPEALEAARALAMLGKKGTAAGRP